MAKFDNTDPKALLDAYVELSADILQIDVSEIGEEVPIDQLFRKRSHWRHFSNRSLEIAELSSAEATAIMGPSIPNQSDTASWVEMRSLSTLAAFSETAANLLKKRQKQFEVPTLKSLATTYAARIFHPSGVPRLTIEPKTRNAVYTTVLGTACAALVVSAFITRWSYPISEFGQSPLLNHFFLTLFLFLGVAASCFVVFLLRGLRSLRRDASA